LISIITNKWGENIGLQAGNAHEKNQNVIHEIKDIYSHKFKTLSDADQAVDLLNNVIGREIGKTTSIDSTSKDIAKKVLDYYYTNGLNIVKETDDGYYVTVKERLSYERYKDDLIILETLDENGFPSDNKYYNKKGD
jgi:complete genome; segment 1/17